MGDMATLETLGLQNGGKLEVEVHFNIEVSVDGRGAGYNANIEFGPEEKMSAIEDRVFFFNMFKQRSFQLFSPDLDRVFEDEELQSTLFRDSGLKNNNKLVLRQKPKGRMSGDESSEVEIDEDMMAEGFEGGEDEIEDMDEEGENEMIEPPGGADVPEDPEAADDDAKVKGTTKK